MITIAALLLIGTPRIVSAAYESLTRVEQVVAVDEQNMEQRMPERPRNMQIEEPSFINSAKANLTTGFVGKLNYQFGMSARGYITMAMFIFGLVAGRLRFFEQVQTKRKRNFILFGIFVLGTVAISLIIGLIPQPAPGMWFGPQGGSIPASVIATMGLNDVKAVLLSGAIAMGFIIFYQTKGIGRCLDMISSYGRMGLTNYFMQSVIGCLLFSLWAFGSFFGCLGTTGLFLLGVAVYALQVVASRWWIKHYLYGPLEWFWRSATYLKLQPFKK